MPDVIRIRVTDDGTVRTQLSSPQTIKVNTGNSSGYVLPTASETTLGGIKVGEALTIADGVLSVVRANTPEEDNTLPITAGAVYMVLGDIDALLSTI